MLRRDDEITRSEFVSFTQRRRFVIKRSKFGS